MNQKRASLTTNWLDQQLRRIGPPMQVATVLHLLAGSLSRFALKPIANLRRRIVPGETHEISIGRNRLARSPHPHGR